MIFNSIEFIFYFIPIFFSIYYICPAKGRNFVLLAGSFVFYAWGDIYSLPIVVLSAFVNYSFGSIIEHRKERSAMRKVWLFLAVIFHVGVFCMFRMGNILSIMPLGLSFYTFQAISYVADVYLGKIHAEQSPIGYFTYFFMFPKFVSGPITRYGEIQTALEHRKISPLQVEEGLKIFAIGLGGKVLIADQMGKLWNAIQTVGFESISMPLAWLGAIAVSLQIYFDFQGYSLMAIGLGRMLGFKLPQNFRQPYTSGSVTEFWRNWHMTLSLWFRDYVYIPLGGSKKGVFRTICNLLVVWVLTGLWHGTTGNFLLWGIGFFILLTLEKLFLKKALDATILLKRVYMFFVIPISWIVFSITDAGELYTYLQRMFDVTSFYDMANLWDVVYYLKDYGWTALFGLVLSTTLPSKVYEKCKKHFVTAVILILLFWLSVYYIMSAESNPFLYSHF
ncbi:MAG: MBOAT family protein [Lachnospiraceae bacterium]|nr:MBOAT family protein [Lachnospiraceae bacterium]